ncbi:MAG TPA: 2OG-Fe(II) oxygenase family protein [Oligoflexia bacterium]|nr:2OG-Fe(II) oxygenase family protein [Oligoflexia bacterium]
MRVLKVDYRSPNAAEEFARSLKETGFAVLNHHPISHQLIEDSFSEWARFFESPSKHELLYDKKLQAGYFPFRAETAKDYKVSDLKEFFHYYPKRGDLPGLAQRATPELYKQLHGLGAELLGWVEDHTPPETKGRFSMPLRKMIDESDDTLLRPIHYPPLSGAEESGAIRAAAHEDINLITLLPAATAPGLQVKDLDGNWHEVECDPCDIAVNSGDMLQMASGGYYVSTTHRVVNPTGALAKTSRYSMPLFLHPAGNVRLSPSHTARSYLNERLGQLGLL